MSDKSPTDIILRQYSLPCSTISDVTLQRNYNNVVVNWFLNYAKKLQTSEFVCLYITKCQFKLCASYVSHHFSHNFYGQYQFANINIWLQSIILYYEKCQIRHYATVLYHTCVAPGRFERSQLNSQNADYITYSMSFH